MKQLTLGFVFLIFLGVSYLIKQNMGKEEEVIPVQDSCMVDSTFDVRDFVLELHLQKIKYPDVVLRQACLESGFFTSKIWREKNNPFGFCFSVDSTHVEYILFNDWRSAISYYKSWQDKRYKGGDYYDFLTKIGYAEDTTYLKNVKGIDLNNLRDELSKK